MTRHAAVAALTLALFGTACDQSPTSPSVAYGASNAVLAVSSFSFDMHVVPNMGGLLEYPLSLVLAETGGRSGLTISSLVFDLENGPVLDCPISVSRIEPGGTQEFHCAPQSHDYSHAGSVIVRYTDDEGHGRSFSTPPAVSSPPDGPSNAVLTFSTLTAHPVAAPDSTPERPQFWYALKVVLAETGGRSGAYIITPVVSVSRGSTDLMCYPEVSRIEPNGTWDMDTLSYCAPAAFGSSETVTLTVTVAFFDDQGHAGSLTRTVEVTK